MMPKGCVCEMNNVESEGKRNQTCCTKGFGGRNQASSDSDYQKNKNLILKCIIWVTGSANIRNFK